MWRSLSGCRVGTPADAWGREESRPGSKSACATSDLSRVFAQQAGRQRVRFSQNPRHQIARRHHRRPAVCAISRAPSHTRTVSRLSHKSSMGGVRRPAGSLASIARTTASASGISDGSCRKITEKELASRRAKNRHCRVASSELKSGMPLCVAPLLQCCAVTETAQSARVRTQSAAISASGGHRAGGRGIIAPWAPRPQLPRCAGPCL